MCLCEQLCVHVCMCIGVCMCLCLWGSSQTRGRYHQWPEVSQRWWNTEAHKAQKKLPPGIISMIGDGCGVYMSSNNWKPKILHLSWCISVHNSPSFLLIILLHHFLMWIKAETDYFYYFSFNSPPPLDFPSLSHCCKDQISIFLRP